MIVIMKTVTMKTKIKTITSSVSHKQIMLLALAKGSPPSSLELFYLYNVINVIDFGVALQQLSDAYI